VLGIILKIEKKVIEDAFWLMKKDNHSNINFAKRDAVVKGMNMVQNGIFAA